MFLLVKHNFSGMLPATRAMLRQQPEPPVVCMQEQELPVRGDVWGGPQGCPAVLGDPLLPADP